MAFPISVASSPRLPADTSAPSSFQREISIFPEEAAVTFWPKLNCAQAPGEVAGGLWAPYNHEGLAAWAPGSCGLIHQLGGFDSDKGLISSDGAGGRFMAPLPPGLEWEISGSRRDLTQPGGGLYEAQEEAGLEPIFETKDRNKKPWPWRSHMKIASKHSLPRSHLLLRFECVPP